MRERSEIVVLTIVETCEARVGMLYTRKDHCRGSVKLVKACLSGRKERESTFHHWGGAVNFVQACLKCQETSRKLF